MTKPNSSGCLTGAMSSRRWIEGLWTATMFLVLIAGCSSSQGHPTSDGDQEGESACPVGTKNCPCDAGDRCQEGLTCTEGYCLESPACTLGTESCSCLAGDRCNDGLVCTDGICIDESCPAGTQGCACIYNNLCNANLECLDQLCVPSGCTPGSLNCVCDDHQCQEGLECKENLCRSAAGGARLKIGNSSVRSCNLILLKGSGTAAGVSFADAVLGRIRVQSDRIGISFTAKQDAALGEAVLRVLDGSGNDVASSAGLSLTQATCYDRLGAAVTNPDLGLE